MESFQKLVDPIYPKTYKEYLPYVQLLHQVLRQSELALTPATLSNNAWLNKLQWLGQHSQVSLILDEYLNPYLSSETATVENLLFLTSALENALANVYQTIAKKSPPHLLKDLLDTTELRDVLGTCPIFFLKIIMGSPESINLRNIFWHGFPLPHEIPACFVATLLIASASLSELVKHIILTPRPQVKDFDRFMCKLWATPTDFTLVDKIPHVMSAIESSPWTGQWKVYWKQVYLHYDQGNYWRCVVLILPQIELVLRKIYGEIKKFDITAKLNEYYITMKNIFEATDDNQVFDCGLSRGTLHFLYDIFISPYGMRIRDKVSHGEVDLDCVGRELCSVLLYAGLNLLNKDGFPLDGYRSRFHLNYLAYEAVTTSKRFVLELMTMKTPKSLHTEFRWSSEAMLSLQELTFTEHVEIFQRPRKEPEIMAHVMKIAQLIVQVCENYQVSFKERFRMFLNHELRSRARKTLDRMIEAMSVIGETLTTIVKCLAQIIGNQKYCENEFDNCQTFCKQTLSVVENLERYSDRESNEWLNALDCCNRFLKISSNFNSK
ncbi:endoplasmic reticulum membrane-associated RNA degradation protein-like isoform X2 [Eupeodes corollae]|uniref:endoplasmic reticulum membrane-associated RNA degradation protein-like isoform X2 n=1 Tax=Eupeodes corollae TaxID=290404 RepID=UPI002492AAF9|nr:endoplasmic reticulum membrane-associated RNA degradation protein-like isoform X2 [Eupeodes corollae]